MDPNEAALILTVHIVCVSVLLYAGVILTLESFSFKKALVFICGFPR